MCVTRINVRYTNIAGGRGRCPKAVQDRGRAGSSSGPDGASKGGGDAGRQPGSEVSQTASAVVSRRQLLQGVGAGAALLGAGRLLGSRTASAGTGTSWLGRAKS